MSKAIRVIDLLNKIANGEEVPEKVKYCGSEYLYLNHRKDYKNMELDFDSCIIDSKYHNLDWLNDTVEIIEEQEEIDIQSIEEIKEVFIENSSCGEDVKYLARKYNEILKWAKQLEKKINNI